MDAFRHTEINIADRIRVDNIKKMIRTEKTMRHVCREIDHQNSVHGCSFIDVLLLLSSLCT